MSIQLGQKLIQFSVTWHYPLINPHIHLSIEILKITQYVGLSRKKKEAEYHETMLQ